MAGPPAHPLWTRLAGGRMTPAVAASLHRYLDLLHEKNRAVNLTAVRDRGEAEVRHVADALLLLDHLPPKPAHVLDFGTGGGVPGVPLAIVRPDLKLTLLDATAKKIAFLDEVVADLKLTNVRTVCARGERPTDRRFDVVVSRAVAAMPRLLGWTMPLLRKNGRLLALKGRRAAEEVAEAQVKARLHRSEIEELAETVVVEVRKK